MKFWQGSLIRRLFIHIATLAGIAIVITLAALGVVQSFNQAVRKAQATADTAALSAHIRSECLALSDMVRRYTGSANSSSNLRNEIGVKQIELGLLMDQIQKNLDPEAFEERQQLDLIRLSLNEFSTHTTQTLQAFDVEKEIDLNTSINLVLLTETYQQPLVKALQDFEYSEFSRADVARAEVDRLVRWVNFGLMLALVLVAIVAVLMVRQLQRRVVAPLENLRRGVAQLRQGDLERVIPVMANDELGKLTEDLNTLATEARITRAQQGDYTRILESQVAASTHEAEQRISQAALLSRLAQSRTEELERLASQALAAQEIANVASGTLDLEMLLQQSVDLIHDRFHLQNVGLFLLDEGKKYARLSATSGLLDVFNPDEDPRLPVDENSAIGWVILHMRYRLVKDVTQDTTRQRYSQLSEAGSELALPLVTHGSVIGALTVQSSQTDAFEPAVIPIFQTMAAQISNAIANAKLYQEVEQLAILDSLTGMYNRRHWFELASREFYRAVRYQKPLSLILLDIDHFKFVNDLHGHPVGDRVLRSLSQICQNNLRTADLVGRYGGEEFLVALPETDEAEAVQIAERLRQATEAMRVESQTGEVQITISLGVSTLQIEADNHLNQLVKHADDALYQAKHSGRNRVAVFTTPLGTE